MNTENAAARTERADAKMKPVLYFEHGKWRMVEPYVIAYNYRRNNALAALWIKERNK